MFLYQIVHFFIINSSRTLRDQHSCSPVHLLFNIHTTKNFDGYTEFLVFWMLPSVECLTVSYILMVFLFFTPSFLLVFFCVLP